MHVQPSSVSWCVVGVIYVFNDVRDRRDWDENVFAIIDSCRFNDIHGMSLREMIICFASRGEALLRPGVW